MKMNSMSYSILIPIYNEKRTLPTLLQKVRKLNKNIEVIIIDDGSTDGTHKLLSNQKSIHVVTNELNSGKGFSIRKGIENAKNKNIILIDGDLEVDIEEIPRLIQKFENNNKKVLVGTRWNKDSNFKFEINSIGNSLINFFFNLLYKTKLNDVLCCFKIVNADFLRSLNIQSNGFEIEVETMAKIILSKISFKEININYKRRTVRQGKKIRLSDGWKILWTIIFYKLKRN